MAILRQTRNLSPWGPLHDVEAYFNRVFGENAFAPRTHERRWTPALDLRETEDSFIIEADMPGMKREDVDIEVMDDVVTITGERKVEGEGKKDGYHHVERSYGSFRRSFSVPGGIRGDKANAEFKDGVLRVTLPKKKEVKPKAIKVKAH